MKQKILLIFTIICCYTATFSYGNFCNTSNLTYTAISEITVCEGETLELTAEPVENAIYKWTTSDNIEVTSIDLIRNNVTLDMAGIYLLNVSLNGCDNTAKIQVIVIPNPNAGSNGTLTINEGVEPTEEQLFNALEGNPDKNGTWQKQGNKYIYMVKSSESCKDLAEATVTVITNSGEVTIEQILIPNSISPNGDGYNDYWVITPNLAKKYPKSNLSVFNRWGNIVYQASPYNNDWNSESIGRATINIHKKLPTGTYFYLIKLNDNSQRKIKGWLYISSN